jgi:hypothetical protein
VPLTAVQGNGDTGTVLVLNDGNRIEQRQVQLGLRGAVLVQVAGGLAAGDRVVLGDPSRYPIGEAVIPRVQKEPANDAMQEEGGVTDMNPGSN